MHLNSYEKMSNLSTPETQRDRKVALMRWKRRKNKKFIYLLLPPSWKIKSINSLMKTLNTRRSCINFIISMTILFFLSPSLMRTRKRCPNFPGQKSSPIEDIKVTSSRPRLRVSHLRDSRNGSRVMISILPL